MPTDKSLIDIFNKNPVLKIQVENRNEKADSFRLLNNNEFFRINEKSGEVWFDPKQNLIPSRNFELIVNLLRENEIKLTQTIIIKFVDQNLELFCENQICFWDSIIYNVQENATSKQTIGVISPLIYKKICPKYKTDYQLKNGKAKRFQFFSP